MRTGRTISFTSLFISVYLQGQSRKTPLSFQPFTAFPMHARMSVRSLRIANFHTNQASPLPCTHVPCTCGLFRAYSLCLAWATRGIVLPDLDAAWMQTACSWVMRPSGRSSVSRRPCVGSGGDLHSLSHCCSQTGSSSCLLHCYMRRQQRHRDPINELGIILHQHSFSSFYKRSHTHPSVLEGTYIQRLHSETT